MLLIVIPPAAILDFSLSKITFYGPVGFNYVLRYITFTSVRPRAANSDYRTNGAAKKETEELMQRLDAIVMDKLDKIINLLEKKPAKEK